jgi:hypothetical protein
MDQTLHRGTRRPENKLNKDGEKGLVDKKTMNGWGVGWAVVRYVSTVV